MQADQRQPPIGSLVGSSSIQQNMRVQRYRIASTPRKTAPSSACPNEERSSGLRDTPMPPPAGTQPCTAKLQTRYGCCLQMDIHRLTNRMHNTPASVPGVSTMCTFAGSSGNAKSETDRPADNAGPHGDEPTGEDRISTYRCAT